MSRLSKFGIGLTAAVAVFGVYASAWAQGAPGAPAAGAPAAVASERIDATGEAVVGKKLFKKRCGTCHTATAGDNRVGPSLFGVVGRYSGQAPGYEYSKNNKADHVLWTEDLLEKYLADPMHVVPGTKMTLFRGLKDPSEIAAIVEFLETQK